MSRDKYPNMFPLQMEVIVLIIIKYFPTTLAVLKIGEHHSDIPQGNIQSRDAFKPITSERKCVMY